MFLLGGILASGPAAGAQEAPVDVDVELVLAVDISMSMDQEEQRLQREGYVRAFLDPLVTDAIEQGLHGRIAVAYMEWAGAVTREIVVDWMLIDGAESAAELSSALAEAPIRRARRTSISGAIEYATAQFAGNGFQGTRQVIDISGDGANNQGRPVVEARDSAVAQGVIINGLPFVPDGDQPLSLFDMRDLDIYYEDCVIGGPGSFSLPVRSAQEFAEAIRNKLVLEIAASLPHLLPASQHEPRVSCMLGEQRWQQFFGGP